MNLQSIMKQAQKMQADILKKQEVLNAKIFPGKYSLVELELLGNKKVNKITISDSLGIPKDDIEMLQDALIVAINNVMQEIDQETEKQMGAVKNIPGMF